MILITGATGKTGGEAARQLAAAGARVRVLVRNAAKAEPLGKLGIEVVTGDMTNRADVAAALRDVDRALLVMPNEQHQLDVERQFTDCAAAAGVRHLVKLSSLESTPRNPNPIAQMHVASEEHIRRSGIAWTMIRPTFFAQTFLGSAARIRDRGEIAMPGGQGTIAPTDIRDVGAVICRVLTESGHENQSYDLTGPELLTFAEAAARFSDVLSRPVRYLDVPASEFAARLQAVGYAPWRVDAICKEFAGIASGLIDHTTHRIRDLLDRPPISLRQFVADHRGVFTAPAA